MLRLSSATPTSWGTRALKKTGFGLSPLVEQAAQEEEPFVLLAFGLLLLTGEHLPTDEERAHVMIRRAAELGSLPARVMLADSIAGVGAELSDAQRREWHELLRYEPGETLSLSVSK